MQAVHAGSHIFEFSRLEYYMHMHMHMQVYTKGIGG